MWAVWGPLGAAMLAAATLAAAAVPSLSQSPPHSPWLDGTRPGTYAHEAAALLAAAGDDGLDPRDYGAAALAHAVAAAAQGVPPAAEVALALAAALDAAMRQLLHDLHRGRIDPRRIHHDFDVDRRTDFDPAVRLQAALAGGRLADAVEASRPPVLLYGRLREALAAHRALVGHAAWHTPLPALPTPRGGRSARLEPGQPWDGVPVLAQRLEALGDLAPGRPVTPLYDAGLVDAVRAFQRRHGLGDDGVIGRATRDALDVTPAARLRQIELTMERLRWTPLFQGRRMIVVNIPEFVLRAYEVGVDGRIHVREEMKVVVGKALDTRTPLFDEDMRFIEFSPYWNIPPSIARAETVPRLRRDPGYLSQQGMEFVGVGGVPDTVVTPAKLDAVLAGRLRIRQRPGPLNALGDIKFVFPNRSSIFLHHTPATALFGRDRRDLSHGCIRVEHPVALARFVLNDRPEWPEARIRAAMQAAVSTTLALHETIPVLIAYGTVLVKGGRPYFFDDLYGLDRLLDAALRARAARPTPGRP